MDIEKLIEHLQNNRHPNGLKSQAATALSTLQAENTQLRAELEQVKAERDEAVECINTVYSYILIKSKTEAVRTIEKWLCGQKED